MCCDSHSVILLRNLVELCLSDAELPCQLCRIQFFREMRLDVFIDLHRQFLLAEAHHPLHAQIGGHCLHDMGGGGDIVFRDKGLLHAGGFQLKGIDMVALTEFPNLLPAFLMRGIGEDMAEEQVADDDISQDE